ncbi:hypothetical protein [Metaclostridioides mangenotii]|uniref:Uncharacterized protein n=1 Tax=Metaclostridioides mangenotii TaxID=1540 RepID=A0ABS4EE97_9FIRM|nr:hypothetical protein [Clostridioides mangenotii]MBP1856264.1 hypothetical protein [Clostridioides mangenotii]
MKKYILVLTSSICVFIVMMINLYYNTINLDMRVISKQLIETNEILDDLVTKKESVLDKKDEYISRLMDIENDLENKNVSFLMKDYKKYKIKSVESLIEAISSEKSEDLKVVNKYNRLSNKELDKLIKNNIAKVTYLSTKSYI